jgi:hypothetical protein
LPTSNDWERTPDLVPTYTRYPLRSVSLFAVQVTVTVPVAVPEGGGGGDVVLPVGEGGGGGGVVPLASTESDTGMRSVCDPLGPLSTI